MSTAQEKIAAWHEGDSTIICHRCSIDRSDASCELCEHWIAALPESRLKARQPGWHLICQQCVNEVRKAHELKFLGRFKTSEEAGNVLP